jgi:DNA primase
MSLAHDFVNELKDKIDLYDLVSPYVQLKKSGSSWVGLSPFSQEKTPSFYVHPDKGFFKCFSSGEKGDAITFVQKMENLSFIEAIEFLSERFNIPMRFEQGSSAPLSKSINSELYALHETVTDWFTTNFGKEGEESRVAQDYWTKERRFTMETAKEFRIGYAPVDRFALAKFLRKKSIPPEILEKSGLFNKELQRGEFASRFCGRLIIPIREKIGRVCGFTARKLSLTPEWGDKKAPKYVNSPETNIFKKGELLFNHDLANKAIDEKSDFLLVEGQLDAIRCWAEGFKTVVAPQGTAFGDIQANLLRKSNPRGVICLLDGDSAGQKAAFDYIPILFKAAIGSRFSTLPEGTDPDQILLDQGPSGLQSLLDQGISPIEYAFRYKLQDISNPTPSDRKKVSEFIFKSLSEVSSFVEREDHLQELSKVLGVSIENVKRDFQQFSRDHRPFSNSRGSPKSREESSSSRSVQLTTAEDDLLFVLLHDNRVASPLAHIFDPSWLDLELPSGRVLAKILAETKADGPVAPNRMEEFLDDDDERTAFQNHLYQDVNQIDGETFLQLANECLHVLFVRSSKQRERILLKHLSNPENAPENTENLRQELIQLRKSISAPPQLISSLTDSVSHAQN